jgi:hypothetical protein
MVWSVQLRRSQTECFAGRATVAVGGQPLAEPKPPMLELCASGAKCKHFATVRSNLCTVVVQREDHGAHSSLKEGPWRSTNRGPNQKSRSQLKACTDCVCWKVVAILRGGVGMVVMGCWGGHRASGRLTAPGAVDGWRFLLWTFGHCCVTVPYRGMEVPVCFCPSYAHTSSQAVLMLVMQCELAGAAIWVLLRPEPGCQFRPCQVFVAHSWGCKVQALGHCCVCYFSAWGSQYAPTGQARAWLSMWWWWWGVPLRA